MHQVICGRDAEVAAWVQARLPDVTGFGPCAAIGVASRGEWVAGVVYNSHTFGGRNIEMSIASTTPAWAQRGVLCALFHYPFRQLKVARVTATTRWSNIPVRDFLCRLGFQLEGIARRAYDDADGAAVYGMLPQECRWLR